MFNNSYSKELQTVHAALSEAALLCRSVQERVAITKGDRSPVTIADFGSQALVCHTLREAFTDPDFDGYLRHRGTGVGFSGKLTTTFRPFQGGVNEAQDRMVRWPSVGPSLFEHHGLALYSQADDLVESRCYFGDFGRKQVWFYHDLYGMINFD
ncbi:MAG: hypothetical protein OXI05_10920 [Bacteroidota bacterium]|nr:hypothetical protein [Bacteroidota bacterium]MXW15296.1 hypothetical protein [Rhodothermaceae bacterium]MDE2646330.1 hypothetical protein [Bacteroidota bacterium]MXW33619.1 hypothetical protein [Rhodothermaceae bacterium]MYC05314.1 hypothetical protein [Rhodothermaceae bacterium]